MFSAERRYSDSNGCATAAGSHSTFPALSASGAEDRQKRDCGQADALRILGAGFPGVVKAAVPGRGYAHLFPELFNEVTLVAEAGFIRDVGTVQIALFEKSLGFLNAQLVNMLQHGFAGYFLDEMGNPECAESGFF